MVLNLLLKIKLKNWNTLTNTRDIAEMNHVRKFGVLHIFLRTQLPGAITLNVAIGFQ